MKMKFVCDTLGDNMRPLDESNPPTDIELIIEANDIVDAHRKAKIWGKIMDAWRGTNCEDVALNQILINACKQINLNQ